VDEPTAITTFTPPEGVDPVRVRQWLIDHRGIVTTACEVARAPFELTGPVLRLSPHVDVTTADLETFGAALEEATRAVG
jgi:pyridoxal 5-phosphate dependent beta-lyase